MQNLFEPLRHEDTEREQIENSVSRCLRGDDFGLLQEIKSITTAKILYREIYLAWTGNINVAVRENCVTSNWL